MTKGKITVIARPAGAPSFTKGIVEKTKPGSVTLWDKAKFYYKWLISATSLLLAWLVENQDLFVRFFGATSEFNGYVAVAILVVGNVGVFLKSNEKWINLVQATLPSEPN